MCGCGIDHPCSGCECGCGHNQDSFIAWQLGYRNGRLRAAQAISEMPDVDALIMEEIENDPDLNETYILIRRVDAALIARGDGYDAR
jgi:hypothetical protein